MKKNHRLAIAAGALATIVTSLALASCEGRKMTNMQPAGETVEVIIDSAATSHAADSI